MKYADYVKKILDLQDIILKQEQEIKRLESRNRTYLFLLCSLLNDYRKEKEKNDNNV